MLQLIYVPSLGRLLLERAMNKITNQYLLMPRATHSKSLGSKRLLFIHLQDILFQSSKFKAKKLLNLNFILPSCIRAFSNDGEKVSKFTTSSLDYRLLFWDVEEMASKFGFSV